eukprot:GHVU01069951.1.p1 GENE.GHVU01069951.1~~GHVU01069951.1.p1  ORF type:complete len:226 (-),score=40.26 GHVU01069951.1:1023-1700(-)
MKSRTITILLLAVGAGCQFIKGEAAAAADFEAELDARTSEKATVKEEDADAAWWPRIDEWPQIPEVKVPIADSDEEGSSPSGEERMMLEVEEANAEECELGESADKRSTKATTCQGDYLRRARGFAYYRAPPVAYYPRRPVYAPRPYFYVPRRMEEDGHEYRVPPRGSSPPRPGKAPSLRREGNDWVVLFPEPPNHHQDFFYTKVTISKVYDHYLSKYTYVCGGQ